MQDIVATPDDNPQYRIATFAASRINVCLRILLDHPRLEPRHEL